MERQHELQSQKYCSWCSYPQVSLISSFSTSVTNNFPSWSLRNFAEHAGLAHFSSTAASATSRDSTTTSTIGATVWRLSACRLASVRASTPECCWERCNRGPFGIPTWLRNCFSFRPLDRMRGIDPGTCGPQRIGGGATAGPWARNLYMPIGISERKQSFLRYLQSRLRRPKSPLRPYLADKVTTV